MDVDKSGKRSAGSKTVTSEEALRKENEDRQILNTIWQRQHQCFEAQRLFA